MLLSRRKTTTERAFRFVASRARRALRDLHRRTRDRASPRTTQRGSAIVRGCEHGAQGRTHIAITKLEANTLEHTRHRVLTAKQRLSALPEQRFQRETRRFEKARPSQQITDDSAEFGIRDWLGRTQVYGARKCAVVHATLQGRDLIVQMNPRKALLARADRAPHEQLERARCARAPRARRWLPRAGPLLPTRRTPAPENRLPRARSRRRASCRASSRRSRCPTRTRTHSVCILPARRLGRASPCFARGSSRRGS
jgi:hypothetical protein